METGWRKGVFLCNRQCFRIHSADIQALLTFKLSDVFLSCIYVTWKESTVDMFTSYKHICTHTHCYLAWYSIINHFHLNFMQALIFNHLDYLPPEEGEVASGNLLFLGLSFSALPTPPVSFYCLLLPLPHSQTSEGIITLLISQRHYLFIHCTPLNSTNGELPRSDKEMQGALKLPVPDG